MGSILDKCRDLENERIGFEGMLNILFTDYEEVKSAYRVYCENKSLQRGEAESIRRFLGGYGCKFVHSLGEDKTTLYLDILASRVMVEFAYKNGHETSPLLLESAFQIIDAFYIQKHKRIVISEQEMRVKDPERVDIPGVQIVPDEEHPNLSPDFGD